MKKKNKRAWYPIPAPWRKRITHLATLLDNMQREIEISIGWSRGTYCKRFRVSVEDLEDAKLLVKFFKLINQQDCEIIGYIHNQLDFNYSVCGLVTGVVPKLKRIRVGGKNVEGTKEIGR